MWLSQRCRSVVQNLPVVAPSSLSSVWQYGPLWFPSFCTALEAPLAGKWLATRGRQASSYLFSADTWHWCLIQQDTSTLWCHGANTFKCQMWLRGGLVCIILYTSKSEWSSRHQNVYLIFWNLIPLWNVDSLFYSASSPEVVCSSGFSVFLFSFKANSHIVPCPLPSSDCATSFVKVRV